MRLLIILLVMANLFALARIVLVQGPPLAVVHPFHPERVAIVSGPGPTPPAAASPDTASKPAAITPASPQAPSPSASQPTPPLPVQSAPSTSRPAASTSTSKPPEAPATSDDHAPSNAVAMAAVASAAVQTTAPAPLPASADMGSRPAAAVVCINLGPVPEQDTADAQTRLNALLLGDRLISVDAASAHGPYWVYLPPLASKQAADDRVTQLQKDGIKDVSVIRNGPWKNALSLGVFAKEEAAVHRADSLKKQGLPVQIEAHGAERSFILKKLSVKEQNDAIRIAHDLGITRLRVISCQGAP